MLRKFSHRIEQLGEAYGVRMENRPREHVLVSKHDGVRHAGREDTLSHQIENLGRNADAFEGSGKEPFVSRTTRIIAPVSVCGRDERRRFRDRSGAG